MLFYLWVAIALAVVWLYFKPTRYSKHGIKSLSVKTVLSNTINVFMRKENIVEELDRCYNAFPEERFIGRFELTSPIILVRDIELIKNITVKDFEHFLDHRAFVNEKIDPLFGRNLVSLKGQEWKDMRSTLSPAFTSSKIRHMVPFMLEVGRQMLGALKTRIQESRNDYVEVDVKDLTTRYANDVIASCAFGLNVNSHKEENEFYLMVKRSIDFGGFVTFIKFFCLMTMPRVMSKLKISIIPEPIKAFFKNLVSDTMKNREAQNIYRPDMIHLLMEAKKGQLVHEDKAKDADVGFATVEESNVGKKKIDRVWSDNDLTAQAIIFLLAGFDTVSTAMSFVLHELAVNPDVQETLVQEIRETDAKNGGKLDYNDLQKMKYMDMVVSESLRLWPPAAQLDRLCVKDYNLGTANNEPSSKDYHIRAGEALAVPVYSIHRDPKYFPDPLKFDPERFSDENKHKIQPFTYMPFGSGPRNCIGSRFALCEVKVLLYQLLQEMEVTPSEKTCIPGRLNPGSFNFVLKGGHWLRFKKRSR